MKFHSFILNTLLQVSTLFYYIFNIIKFLIFIYFLTLEVLQHNDQTIFIQKNIILIFILE